MRLGPDDYELAARVLLAPEVAQSMRQLTPDRLRRILGAPTAYVLLPDPDCLFVAHPFVGRSYLVHQAALPAARGLRVREAGRAATRWMFENAPATCLIGITPQGNRAAVLMAGLIGLSHVGVIPDAYDGDDAVVTAISRATFLAEGPDGGGR